MFNEKDNIKSQISQLTYDLIVRYNTLENILMRENIEVFDKSNIEISQAILLSMLKLTDGVLFPKEKVIFVNNKSDTFAIARQLGNWYLHKRNKMYLNCNGLSRERFLELVYQTLKDSKMKGIQEFEDNIKNSTDIEFLSELLKSVRATRKALEDNGGDSGVTKLNISNKKVLECHKVLDNIHAKLIKNTPFKQIEDSGYRLFETKSDTDEANYFAYLLLIPKHKLAMLQNQSESPNYIDMLSAHFNLPPDRILVRLKIEKEDLQ